MLKNGRNLALGLLFLMVIAAVVGFYWTIPNDATVVKKSAASRSAEPSSLVDQDSLRTARTLSRTATTKDEDEFANEALRLGDRSVDLAFAMALRDAELNPPPQTAQLKALSARIDKLEAEIKVHQEVVKEFTAMLDNPGKSDPDELREQIETAKAQQSVSEDELEDAKQSLVSAGGDRQSRIQQMHDEHEASQKDISDAPPQSKSPTYVLPSHLLGQAQTWHDLRTHRTQFAEAQQQALARAQDLARKHDQLTRDSAPAASLATHSEALASLHRQSLQKQMLADYNKRIQDEQQLAQTYVGWSALLATYQQRATHGMLLSAIWILLIVAAMVAAEGLVSRFYRDGTTDRRKVGTMRMALRFATQVGGVLAILLVIFGPPSQLSTFLALAGAGLTVALKDFIVAFFGWFVLMGRNGIRVGDWVEINGIGGEVVEIGVLRTVILETGNWSDAGHPTGRKVAFVNSFAIEGHYFNFSTTGQWLWDELEVLVPAGKDSYEVSEGVRKILSDATASDVVLAQQEWQRATHSDGMKNFSAAPAIDVRSTGAGVTIAVRYITRANVRYELRTKLNQSIVELLHVRTTAAKT
jgi:small-conductance mechanosensitive channel